jgi:hypothetical protein
MKQCIRCGNTLTAEATYCHVCNTPQTGGFEDFEIAPKQSDTFLKVLCILTIIGVAFGLIGSAMSLMGEPQVEVEGMQFLTYSGIAIALGKLAGAILMLQKKLNGLYIYTTSAILGLIMQIYSMSIMAELFENMPGGNIIMIASTVISLLIVITFIVLYWLPVNRRLLS